MKESSKILIVDDEPTNLEVLLQILKDHHRLIFATTGEKALSIAKQHQPDLILLDIMMPQMDGYEVCRRLKVDAATASIPVIFVSAMSEIEDETHGFDVGAVDYIQKPVSGPIVLRRVKNHLSLVRVDELDELARTSILMMGVAGHYNDTDTGDHIWRMASYSAAIARAAGWTTDGVKILELAAPMHDTGKIGIPDGILKAPRKLTVEEWRVMKTHSQIGHDILAKSRNTVFKMAAEIALGHHERWDGTGYPNGFAGEDITESARIVAIADVFDALTMKRPYKEPWPVNKALATIEADAGSHFDPRLVESFLAIEDEILNIQLTWNAEGEVNK